MLRRTGVPGHRVASAGSDIRSDMCPDGSDSWPRDRQPTEKCPDGARADGSGAEDLDVTRGRPLATLERAPAVGPTPRGGRGAFHSRSRQRASSVVRASAGLLTFTLLAVVQLVVERPMLLAERFVPGGGWIESLALAGYAAWLVGLLYDPHNTVRWRRRLWTLFSLVFFTQLAIGLAGVDAFLMSGTLHLPIPAMIVAGPLYRGAGVFMPILFGATVLLVGPAWCSYLCYVGSWDLTAACARRRSSQLPWWRNWVRGGVFMLIALTAVALGLAGVPAATATALGLAVGIAGVAIMVVASRRTGSMIHCTIYCPVGLAADVLGKLSPFRLRIRDDACTDCGACALRCRYGALRPENIARRRPGLSCTLCGDCLAACRGRAIEYRLPLASPATARSAFLVLVVSLHAVFLGVARI
jgi:NAD-dependent dihydropyrimidine dehydrogenase PreA subunit